ncbi:MAG: Erwinia phage phiEaP-8 [Pseudomonadota bacterium]|jgi:hypothetical protein
MSTKNINGVEFQTAILIDPTTGLPYRASGGGGGGGGAAAGGAPVIDASGVRWLWVYDAASSASTYVNFATGAAGTPAFPLTPDADTSVAVSNFPATQAVSGPLTAAELAAAGLALDATVQATNTALGTDGAAPPTIAGTGVRGWLRGIYERLPALVSNRVPVDPNVAKGAGAVDANTQRVALGNDSPGVASLASIDTDLGLTTDAAATTDTGTFSLIALVKRSLTNWTTLLGRIPASVSGRVPVNSSIPTTGSGTILQLQTSTTGSTYVAFQAQACVALDIVNNTGVTIEYRRGATGTAMQIPNGAARMVIGITNANQIDVRRTDTSNTQVTLQAEAFTA